MGNNQFASLNSIPEEVQTPNGEIAHHNGGHAHFGPPSEISDHCRKITEHENQYKSSIVVYADCHAASRGLFGKFKVLWKFS